MRKLKILFVTTRFPFPLIGGDRVKSYQLIRHLAANHDVTLATFNHGGPPTQEQVDHLQSIGVRLVVQPLKAIPAAINAMGRIFSKKPLEVLFYTQPAMKRAIQRLLENERFDLAFAFFIRSAEYLRHADIPKMLIAEDCRTLYQSRSVSNSASLKQSLVRWWEVRKLRQYEPDIVRRFDFSTYVTLTDIEHMQRLNHGARYRLLTNGVDLDRYAFKADQRDRKDILFLGKLNIYSNEMMVRSIAQAIFPLIQKRMDGVRCHIIGARPPKSIRNLAVGDIVIHADVPEINPFFHNSAVFLHPHRGASGIQNKVLEAMALGCPVVTTPSGIQGIQATPGSDVLIGATDNELADHCVALLQDEQLRQTIAQNARALVEQNHDWRLIFDQMDDLIEESMELFAQPKIKQ